MDNNYLQKSLEFDKHLLALDVNECGEEFVSLPGLFAAKNIPVVFNDEVDKSAKTKKYFYLRKSVAEALVSAGAEFFELGYLFQIEDGYRSLEIQRTKFLMEVDIAKKKFPDLSLIDVKGKVNTYIAGIPILAAHTAGAAIDAILIDKNTKKSLDFGASYYDLSDIAVTENPVISKPVMENRMLFKTVMEKHGLINYPFEFWHFSMGDVCAAYLKQQKSAIYAPVSLNLETGKIEGYISPRMLRTYF